MRNIKCLRIWNNRQFSLECSFDIDDTVTLENVHGRNCDANEIPQYVIDCAFGFIEDRYNVGVSIEDIAASATIFATLPADSNPLWGNYNIQFARLIAEGEAAGIFTEEKVREMCVSMDLEKDELFQIIDRAQLAWNKQKNTN